jgi:DnaK suppressor protein
MNVNVPGQQVNDVAHGGGVWYRLRAEREDICEALLREPQTVHMESAQAADSTIDWHRELLQARLRKIDDALDRLMAGSYGSCSKCGRWIEDTKLDFDPAVAYCIECWPRVQTIH